MFDRVDSKIVFLQGDRSCTIEEREQCRIGCGVPWPSYVASAIGIVMIDEVDEVVSQVSWTVDDVEIGDMELQNVNESESK